MTCILVATPMEAAPLITLLSAQPIPDAPFETHRFGADGWLVISGIGPARAAKAAEHAIAVHGATRIINAGICGALSDTFEPGTVLTVATADATPCCPWGALRAVRLATVEEPIFQDDLRRALAETADIVDMEGHAIAAVCERHGVPCTMVKGVSDFANEGGRDVLQQNIASVSARVAQVVVAGLAPKRIGLRGLLRFVKVEHTVFSLPLLFAGAWLGGGGSVSLRVLGLIALAGVGARTLGMAMNRILDHKLDAANPRTAGRELPTGRMSLAAAGGVALAGLAAYLAACAMLSPLCLMLSPAPAVPLLLYPLLKRFTNLCHFGIGVCMALAPLCAFIAASGHLHFTPQAWLLAVFAFAWISGFDIIYATQDIDADRETGVRSLPASLGASGAEAVALAVHVLAVGAMSGLWYLGGGGPLAGVACAVSAAGFVAGHWPTLPAAVRFFPVSVIAGVAGAIVPLLGDVG
ncbi:UbiA family prenyltransferase [bacterium]|nr:UbiA family prenyltransferase [bacterium]